jgi:hypothetical protein
LHKGGTTFADLATVDLASVIKASKTPTARNHERLDKATVAAIVASLRDIRADRDRSYAPFLDELLDALP